jgi:serine/threonine protein kinase
MFECLSGAASSAALVALISGFFGKKLVRKAASNGELLRELEERGFNIQDFAMEAYLKKTFEIIYQLGEGNSGQVWKIRKRRTGEIFAVKKISKQQRSGRSVSIVNEAIETELNCLRKLRHPHIVNVIETIESSSNVWVVMECAEGGELYKRILELDHFSERVAARMVKQVLKAVHYMHSYGVVHRDLKLENILLTSKTEDSSVKVADFGLAVVRQNGLEGYRPDESMHMKKATFIREGFVGSPICMAPEVAKNNAAYGPQCDVWSVGCITFELLSGHPPFNAATAPELFHLVDNVSGPSFDDWIWLEISHDAKDIVRQMLRKLPEERLSAREALHHNWFRTAPDNHMASALSAIVRRLTSEAATRNTTASATTAEARATATSPATAATTTSRTTASPATTTRV